MSWAEGFAASNMLALVGWVLLLFGPRRHAWLNLVPGLMIPLALAASYSVIVLVHFARAEGGFDTLANVRLLFQSDPSLVAGWQHFLAFDLLVGGWAAGYLDRCGVHRIVQVPILAAIFMFGPMGFLLAAVTGATTARLTGENGQSGAFPWPRP